MDIYAVIGADFHIGPNKLLYPIPVQPSNGYGVLYIVANFNISHNNQMLLKLMSKSDLIFVNCNDSIRFI